MVSDFEDQGDSVIVATVDGRTFSGPALVAADGVRSLFREKLIGDGEPRTSGYAALRTIIPMAELKVDVPRDSVPLWAGQAITLFIIPYAMDVSSTLWQCFAQQAAPRKPTSQPTAPSLNIFTAMPIHQYAL